MSEKEFSFDLQKSPESPRDWHFRDVILCATNLPDRVDLKQYVTKIYNQGSSGLCHSFAGAALKNMQETIEGGRKYFMSPIALAKKVKEIDGDKTTEGSTLLNVCKALTSYGTIEEIDYPYEYVAGSFNFADIKNEENVPKYKIGPYAKCDNLNDIKQALNLKKGVLIGILCFQNIYDIINKGATVLPMPSGRSIGGHAMFVVGYDDKLTIGNQTGFLIVVNSWGEKCGEKGIIYIPYDYIELKSKDTNFSYLLDAFSVIDLKNDPIKEDVVIMKINNNKMTVNGMEVVLDIAPIIDPKTSRTMMPLRWVEALGFNVGWDSSTETITLIKRTNS